MAGRANWIVAMQLSPTEKKIVNGWQKGFPLTTNPFAIIADELGIDEQQVISILKSLKARGVLSRVGAVVRPNTVGASSLVAMAVTPEKLDHVAAIVCSEACVNHNYEREDELNLWFVVTAPDAYELDATLARLEQNTGCKPVKLPLEKAYHIDLGFCV